MSFFQWLTKRAIPWYTGLGLTSRTVTLEVRGRKTGRPIRLSLSRTACGGKRYFVSLAGEVDWVKNVRASAGQAVMISGTRVPIQLKEFAQEESAPVLLAYVQTRAFSHSGAESSRLFFGLGPRPTLEEMEKIAGRYPVFEIEQV